MSFKENAGITASTLWFSIVLTAIVTGIIGWFVFIQPYFLTQERRNVTHSHQYIESKRGLLVKLAQEHADGQVEMESIITRNKDGKFNRVIEGMQNQQDLLKQRIREEATNLPDNEIPKGISKFLK